MDKKGVISTVLTDKDYHANYFATQVRIENRCVDFNRNDQLELLGILQ
jgi:hypothetical protein